MGQEKKSQLWDKLAWVARFKGNISKAKHIMGNLWAKKKNSQLWAETGMGFRYYLKCQKVGNLTTFNIYIYSS
jgi:hypothetical protein